MRFFRIFLTVIAFLIITSGLSYGSLGQGHLYISEQLLGTMPDALKERIEKQKEAYRAGANGPDIVYWGYFTIWKTFYGAPAEEFDLHTDRLKYHAGNTAVGILELSKQRGEKERAFAVGWVTHWLVDTYVHTLVSHYGGEYGTSAGQNRHTQLEIAESKHICSSMKGTDWISGYALAAGHLSDDFLFQLYENKKFAPSAYDDSFLSKTLIPFDNSKPHDLVTSRLQGGRHIVDCSIKCVQMSCGSGKAECPGTLTEGTTEGWKTKESYLLSNEDYAHIKQAIQIGRVTVIDNSLQADVKIRDNRLYGKFLIEWDRVVTDIVAFVASEKLFERVQGFLDGKESRENIQKYFGQVSNILNPKSQLPGFDKNAVRRYADVTLRGNADISKIEYEFAAACDEGKNIGDRGYSDIVFDDKEKQTIRLNGSKSGNAALKVDLSKLDLDKDKTCRYTLLVSFVNPETDHGSYILSRKPEESLERETRDDKIAILRNKTKIADPQFQWLEYDTTTGTLNLGSCAEAKYRWLKDSVVYLEALRELDRKTFVAFKSGVTSAMVREFVASHPSSYEDGAKLPDCKEITGDVILRAECVAAQQAGCGTSVGDARIRMNQYGSECSSTLEKGCNVVKMIEVTRKIDGKDVRVAETVTDCDEICGKARACEKVFTTYSGRAGYASDIQGFINENYQRCLGDAGAKNGQYQRELSKKIEALPETHPYKRWQEYKAYSDWRGYLAAVEKVRREFNLLDPIPSHPVLPWTYSSPCGSGGAVKEAGKLQIQLKKYPEKNIYHVGEKINVTAEAIGGKAPYSYAWTGDHEGKDKSVAIPLSKIGQNRLKVSVRDSAGTTGDAGVTFEVVALQMELIFEPKEPYVGQELKAKLTVKPEAKEIEFRWMPLPDNAKPAVEAKDGREIAFTLNNDNPAEIKVRAMTPKSGEVLGEGKNTIKAKKYIVNVTGPKAMGPKPKVWKEGVGLVDVEKEIAVDQVVEFAADTQPAALTGPVKYRWTATGDSCTLSNATSRAARATASAAGGCAFSVVITDRNDVQLGEGKGSFNATITREEIKQGQEKARQVEDAKKKVQDAKVKERKGDLDGAIMDVDGALKLDEKNREAAALSAKFHKDRETIGIQLGKTRTLMGENRFPDAQRELIVAKNLHGLWPPVLEAYRELGDKWRAYDGQVRDKIYEVRSASEKKEFGRALEIAAAWRASTKLDPYTEKALKEQEDWAGKWKAQKDRQIGSLKAAGEKLKNYDFAGALKSYDEGFANGQNIYNGTEPEYKEAVELRSQAFTKNKRLGELSPVIRDAAENRDAYYNQNHVLEGALKAADEAIALQPTNEQLKKWREQILARAEKTKTDNERIAAGRKHLDAARNAENGFLSQDAYIRGGSGRWSESIEGQMQANLVKAIENYRESLKYIPDAAVEKHIRELEATVESRKKFAENVRQSKQLRAEADGVLRDARAEASFEASQEKFTKAMELYNKSLSLYLPPDEQTLRQIVHGAGKEKLSRAFRKFYTDCGALEREGKIVEALAACEKAVENRYVGMHEGEWILLGGQVQNLRSRVAHAKKMRAQGEGEERAGKITVAVTSYRESLKNVPDAALEQHVKTLEARLAEANQGKATADRLWQEGAGLYSQGQFGAALDKFKESLGHWSDATRSKYVQDLEARKARAKQLRDEGYALQQKSQAQAAIGKYRESLNYWPDKNLEEYIRQLAAKQPATPVAPPPTQPTSPAGIGTVPSRDILASKMWQFGRSDGTVLASRIRLLPGGRIEGATHSNETQWAVVGNELLFYDSSGKVATRYNSFRQEGGRWVISGPFLLWGNITHVLREIAEGGSPPAVPPSVSRPADTGGSAPSTVKAPVRTVTAEITNRSKENTHIFAENETFGPGNRLAPGEKRRVAVTMKSDGSVTFKAGRNGQVMATKTWRGNPGDTTRVPVVVFDDTNPFDKLTVTTGLR